MLTRRASFAGGPAAHRGPPPPTPAPATWPLGGPGAAATGAGGGAGGRRRADRATTSAAQLLHALEQNLETPFNKHAKSRGLKEKAIWCQASFTFLCPRALICM
jgi:hypothetical protein